jgi:hypothetical protein
MLRKDVNVTVFSNILVIVGFGETATLLKRPRTPPSTTPTVDYQSADSEHLMKRARPGVQPVDEVKTVSIIYHTGRLTSRLSLENMQSMHSGNILYLKFDFQCYQLQISLFGVGTRAFRALLNYGYLLFILPFVWVADEDMDSGMVVYSFYHHLFFSCLETGILDRSIMLDQAIHRILFQLMTCQRMWPAISIRAHVL